MSKKKIIYLPISIFSVIALAGCASHGITGGINTVTITYLSGDDGNFNDGISENKVVVKTVRKGVKWKHTTPEEKPVDPTHNRKDDGMVFDNKWKTTVKDKEYILEDTSDFAINDNLTFTACYRNNIRNFRIDTWDKVIELAEKGFETLKQYYIDDYNSDVGKQKETFVGLERDIIYAGEVYKVRVIDEKKDILYDNDQKVATLTFEFKNVLPGFSFNDSTDLKNANKYNGSSLQTKLNNDVLNNITSFNSSHFQKVAKETYDKDIKDNVKSAERVFIPSNLELDLLTDVSNKDMPYEGDPYKYYANNDDIQKSRIKKYRPFNDPEGEEIESSYWTRSADNTNGLSSWPIDIDGHSGIKDDTNYISEDVGKALGVAPCFCIGVSDREYASFKDDKWTNIVKTANKGYKTLKEKYFKDWYNPDLESDIIPGVYRKPKHSFTGLTRNVVINNKTYECRVIGENHDYLYNPQNAPAYNQRKVAPLTFELTTDYDQEKTIWSDYDILYTIGLLYWAYHEKNYHYCNSKHTSQLHSFLNDDDKLKGKFDFQDGLKPSDVLRPTYKQIFQATDQSGWSARLDEWEYNENTRAGYVNESVFCLTTFELGREDFEVQKSIAAGEATRKLTSEFLEQGYVYDYYNWNSITDKVTASNVEDVGKELNARRKKEGFSNTYSFLKQSIPKKFSGVDGIYEIKTKAFNHVMAWNNETGDEYNYDSDPYKRGAVMSKQATVVPCFAIGEQLVKDIGKW